MNSLEDALDEIDSNINSASVYAGDGIEPEFHQNGGMIFNARFSNPNLLRNWYFGRPVNQRGKTSYTRGSADGYGIDCWKMMTATPNVITIGDGYLELSQNALIGQLLENPYELCDKRITASVLTNYGLFSFSADVPSKAELSAVTADLSIGSANITVPGDTPGYIGLMHTKGHNTMLRLRAYEGHTINFIAVKLELGSVQTLAHQDSSGAWVLNEIPDYAEQLRRCQRYLYVQRGHMLVCGLITSSKKTLNVAVSVPVLMWSRPSLKGVPSVTGVRTIQGTNIAAEITGGAVISSASYDTVIAISLNTQTFNTAEYINNTPIMCYIGNVMLSAEL